MSIPWFFSSLASCIALCPVEYCCLLHMLLRGFMVEEHFALLTGEVEGVMNY